jgi:hypothetical protein
LTLFARPKGPRGAGNLKFTIYVPLAPKMHHIKGFDPRTAKSGLANLEKINNVFYYI